MTPDGQAIIATLRAAIIRNGWSATARLVDVDRTALHRAFSPKGGKQGQSFGIIADVAAQLGLQLTVTEGPPNG